MAQSKVGRVPHVRDAPPSIRPETVRRAEDCQSYRGSCHSVRVSTPAEIRSGQRYYLQAFTAPVLWHPKKDLKPVPLTGWHCGQDGRAPVWPGG